MTKKKKSAPMPGIRDRIKELRRVKAADLKANPKNWRTHPDEQKSALRGMLEEVGIANAVIARELSDGALELIDGHLRKDLDPDQELPVLVLDVNEGEANKLLLTIDPLAGMAKANSEALDALMRQVQTGNEAVGKMIADLATKNKLLPKDAAAATLPADKWEIVVELQNEDEQKQLYERFVAEGLKCRVLTF